MNNNLSIFQTLISRAASTMRINNITTAKVSSQINNYNSDVPHFQKIENNVILCGKTKCGDMCSAFCRSENSLRRQ